MSNDKDVEIVVGKIEYAGKCTCGRKDLNGNVICDGVKYKCTPHMINGQPFPPGAKETFWCRNRHFRPRTIKDDAVHVNWSNLRGRKRGNFYYEC